MIFPLVYILYFHYLNDFFSDRVIGTGQELEWRRTVKPLSHITEKLLAKVGTVTCYPQKAFF